LAIQEDETAVVLYMLGEYFNYSHDEEFVRSLYATLIQPAANFMCSFIDKETNLPHASYDLWEMKFFTNTYSVAVVYQALLVAADFAEQFEFPDDALAWKRVAQTIKENSEVFYDQDRNAYRKGFLLQPDGSLQFENTIDVSSFYGAMMFGLYTSSEMLRNAAHTIEDVLLDSTPSGGAPRFEHDGYFLAKNQYLGNPWIITTLWMAQYYIRANQEIKARKYIDWALSHSLPSGVLPEQVDPDTGFAVSVTPLVWSHAELINTVLDISK
jgi:GH15 family glucan-1,4-alpha-glucosidase